MANRKTDDAQNRYDDLVLDTLQNVDKKIDEQIRTSYQQQATLSALAERIRKLEKKVFNGTAPPTPSIFKDPTVQKVLLFIVAGAIAIVATLKGIHLPTP